MAVLRTMVLTHSVYIFKNQATLSAPDLKPAHNSVPPTSVCTVHHSEHGKMLKQARVRKELQ